MKQGRGLREPGQTTIWNVPNVLTMLRLALIGVFLYLFWVPGNYSAACVVFLVAGITDIADGAIARKYGLTTDFGKLMDPAADKLMLIAALISLVSKGFLPAIILVFVLIKEGIMVVAAAFLYKKKIVVYAKVFGKIAAFCFNAGVVLTFLGTTEFPAIIAYHVDWVLFGLAILFAVLAFIQYLNVFWRERHSL